jgi:hypothetical protein
MRLVPLADPMPNLISLPYARCPPLHLQASDWRHLLRLMARLSGTRLEPTVEAMAISKTELKLRTVVQFIKVYFLLCGIAYRHVTQHLLHPATSIVHRVAHHTLVYYRSPYSA